MGVKSGRGGKNVFSFQDQRRTTQATNLQLPKSYVYFQKVKFGPITSFRPSQVTGYRRTFADNKNTQLFTTAENTSLMTKRVHYLFHLQIQLVFSTIGDLVVVTV